MKYTLIIPAAGQGKRMGAGKNKLFLPIASIPLIVHTLRAFEEDEACAEIVLAINEPEQSLFSELLKTYEIRKKVVFVPGGAERQQSVYNGIQVATSPYILVHDGARPFVTKEIVEKILQETVYKGAAICAVPVKDTIKRVQENCVEETIERASLWAVQTPQGFSRDLLIHAHKSAHDAQFLGTDDASLVERLGEEVGVVFGSYYNIKVTTPDDLIVAEAFLTKSV